MILADLGADRDPGGRAAGPGRSTPACRGAGPGTGTSGWSRSTAPARCARLLGRRRRGARLRPRARRSRAGGSAGPTWRRANPGLVYARCRPSRTAAGEVDDYGLLVEARSGFCTQLAGHRPGPIFVDVRAPGRARRSMLTTSVLALLAPAGADRRGRLGRDVAVRRHARHPRLHDRPVRAGRARGRGLLGEGLDVPQLPVPLRRRRARAGLVRRQGHVRPAHRGAGRRAEHRGLLHRPGHRRPQRPGGPVAGHVRRPGPATSGSSGCATAGVAAEPVYGPGEALADPHLAEVGLALPVADAGHDDVVVATPVSVLPLSDAARRRRPRRRLPLAAAPEAERATAGRGLLDGLQGARLLRVRRRAAGRRGAGRPGRRGHQGRAAAGRGHAGRGLRHRRLPAGQAQPGHGHQRARGPAGRRAADPLGRRRPPQLPGRRVGAARHRRGDRRRASTPAPSTATPAPSGRPAPGRGSPATTPSCRPSPGSSGRSAAPATTRSPPRGSPSTWSAAGWPPPGSSPASTPGPPPAAASGWRRACWARGCSCTAACSGATARWCAAPSSTTGQTGYGPGYRLYEAGDGGWLALVVPDAGGAGRACAAGGRRRCRRPTRRCAAAPDDAAARAAEAALEAAFATAHAADWVARLRGRRPAGRAGRAGRPRPVPPGHPRRPGQPAARPGRAPTRRRTGAASSRSARCCARGPTPAAARR